MSEELTVVIPTYNRAGMLRRALDSVAAQSVRPLRLIVVDNASTDDTLSLLAEWKAQNESEQFSVTLLHESVPGAARARKRGEALATSPYIYFLDSDDEMHPEAAQAIIEAFHSHTHPDIVLGRVMIQEANGHRRVRSNRRGSLIINHFHHSTLCTQTMAMRTDYLRSVGGWNQDLRIWDDWELGLRMLLAGANVERVETVFAIYHPTADSVTGDRFSDRAEAYPPVLEAVKKALMDTRHPESRLLRRMLPGRQMMLAAHYRREGRAALSAPLHAAALADAEGDPWQRLSLRLTYAWRAAGLRGADTLLTLLLRP